MANLPLGSSSGLTMNRSHFLGSGDRLAWNNSSTMSSFISDHGISLVVVAAAIFAGVLIIHALVPLTSSSAGAESTIPGNRTDNSAIYAPRPSYIAVRAPRHDEAAITFISKPSAAAPPVHMPAMAEEDGGPRGGVQSQVMMDDALPIPIPANVARERATARRIISRDPADVPGYFTSPDVNYTNWYI